MRQGPICLKKRVGGRIANEIRMQLRRQRREVPTVSLQEPLEGSGGDSGQLTLADVLPDDAVMEAACEHRDEQARVRALLGTLPERERRVLALRYGIGGGRGLTQQEVAARLGISRSYISRIEKRALDTLAQRWREDN